MKTGPMFVTLSIASLTLVSPTFAQDAGKGAQTCVAIVLPSAKGIDGDATEFAKNLRELFVSYLTGPTLRAIPLEARLASQAVEEAQDKKCGYVVVTSITRKRDGGGGFGAALGRAAGAAAVHAVPYGSGAAGAATAAAREAARAGAQAVSSMASTTKAKDELTLEFRVGNPDAVLQLSPKTEKAKAKSDGEDLLTPLVEKAAEAIAATVRKK